MLPSLFLRLGAFFSGIIYASFWFWPKAGLYSLIFFFLALIFRRRQGFFLLIALFYLANWRVQFLSSKPDYLGFYFEQTAVWDFWVCADPEPAWDKQITVLCPLAPSFSRELAATKLIANLPLYPRVTYGDRLQLKCRLEKPPVFPDFNYAAYLSAQGIKGICSWPEVKGKETYPSASQTMFRLFAAKRWALEKLNAALPEPAAGLASALLLGYKKTLHPETEKYFQASGLSHIVAISGGHISLFLNLLIAAGVYLGLNKRFALWPALFFTGGYVLLTGAQASALRSLIMGSILLYTWRRGRLSSAWTPLALAGALMLWHNPELWRYDLGFQLSFLALSGMIAFSPLFNSLVELYLYQHPYRRLLFPLFQAFSLSLSAQLAVWPLLALKSGGISLIAPFSNVLAFGIFSPLVFSLLLALVSDFLGVAGNFLYWPAYLCLQYLLAIARGGASLPGAYWDLPNFTVLQAGLYYFILLIFLIVRNRRQGRHSLGVTKKCPRGHFLQ